MNKNKMGPFEPGQIDGLKKAENELYSSRKELAKRISYLSGVDISTDIIKRWLNGTTTSYDKRCKEAVKRVIQEGKAGKGVLTLTEPKAEEKIANKHFSLAIFGAMANVDDDQEIMMKKLQKSKEYALRISQRHNEIHQNLCEE